MITEIFISYSWWALLAIIVVGIAVTALLYYNNPINKLGKTISIVLSFFRFLTIALLLFLLLSPYIRTRNKVIEKPVILVGVDNSESILLGKDSAYYKSQFIPSLMNSLKSLEGKSNIEYFSFGDNINKLDTSTFNGTVSDYSRFVNFIEENYTGQNIGAVVIAGDGIYNVGVDPVSALSGLNWPVFTIALGDTSGIPDLKIADIRNNSIVYSMDEFPVEVNIVASSIPLDVIGKHTWVRLIENDKEIGKKRIDINDQNFTFTSSFMVEAREAGKRRLRVIVDPVEGERIIKNNSKDIFVDILDTRIKILLLAASPHPDIGAIKESILRNPNFEVEIACANNSNITIDSYNLVILYQLPSSLYGATRLINDIISTDMPVIFFAGNSTNYNHFNRLESGVKIITSGATDIAFPRFNRNFSRFVFTDNDIDQLHQLSPLSVPLGNFVISESSDIFAWQELSGIITDFPMIIYFSNIGSRNAVFVGEGYWLWRIQSKLQFGNTEAMDALFSKTVMFLTADNDKRRFRVTGKANYDLRSDIVLRAEYFNEAFEPENRKDIELKLTNEAGEEFSYVFNAIDNGYLINLERLPVGVYTYVARVVDEEELVQSGDFIVERIELESANIIANHKMLNRIAELNRGIMYYPNEIGSISSDIEDINVMKSKVHYQDSFIGLNALLISMLLLLILVSLEWFLRKYFGNY